MRRVQYLRDVATQSINQKLPDTYDPTQGGIHQLGDDYLVPDDRDPAGADEPSAEQIGPSAEEQTEARRLSSPTLNTQQRRDEEPAAAPKRKRKRKRKRGKNRKRKARAAPPVPKGPPREDVAIFVIGMILLLMGMLSVLMVA